MLQTSMRGSVGALVSAGTRRTIAAVSTSVLPSSTASLQARTVCPPAQYRGLATIPSQKNVPNMNSTALGHELLVQTITNGLTMAEDTEAGDDDETPSDGGSGDDGDLGAGEPGDTEGSETGEVGADDLDLPLFGTTDLKPAEIVEVLNRNIVGQQDAKKAVAVALRNRWRRHKLPANFKADTVPKNILMIGPTGCGKTEIARRLAKMADAPFVKVEATKYTEIGFHGKDVDQIIRDLVETSINMTNKLKQEKLKAEVALAVEELILDMLVGKHAAADSRASFRGLLRQKSIELRPVTIEVPAMDKSLGNMADPKIASGMDLTDMIHKVAKGLNQKKKKEVPISEAREILEEAEMQKRLDSVDVTKEAIKLAEQNGIVFIDEIDKICTSSNSSYRGADASAEGVQRDLLPIIEGSTVSTKHGNVDTDQILFVCSGAFHSCKPSDLLAELQGRLPVRVNLKGLTEDDMYRILTEPETNLLKQQQELMKTENVNLHFTEPAIREIAKIAAEVNKMIENIGARRLHTVIERIVEELSYTACDRAGEDVTIDVEEVQAALKDLRVTENMARYIL